MPAKPLEAQYANGANLNARIAIYDYAVGRVDWHGWLFDHLGPLGGRRILEVGAGTGLIWQKNRARLAPDTQVHCTDLSIGMAGELKAGLADQDRRFSVLAADAQSLPFAAASFDIAIANHMLTTSGIFRLR